MTAKQLNSKRTISMTQSIVYFTISLVINAIGNVLTLVTSAHISPHILGSAYWTAAQSNLGTAVLENNSLVLFWAFLILGMMISLLNAILLRKFDWKRIAGNFIFMLPFSIFIQWFSNLFNQMMPDAHSGSMVFFIHSVEFLRRGSHWNCNLDLSTR